MSSKGYSHSKNVAKEFSGTRKQIFPRVLHCVWLKLAFFLTFLCVLIQNQSRLSHRVLGSKLHPQMAASLQEVTTKQANSYISSKA